MGQDDLRRTKLRRGLEQLRDDEIAHLLAYQEPMVYDEFNYEESTGRW